jgi:Protein of unknown function (DUF1552)
VDRTPSRESRATERHRLERRRFLKSLGSAALAAPFFLSEMLTASAVQAATAPRRLIVFATAMGTIKQHWVQPPGQLQKLGPLLAPLQPYMSDLNLILNDGGGVNKGGGHGAWGRLITGLALETSGPAGPGNGASIDQFLGKQIGSATRFPVLELGAALDYSDGEQYCRLVYADGKKSMTAEGDPTKTFQRLYGMSPGVTPPPSKPLLGPKAMVDRLTAEVSSLRKRLGPAEQTKLDVHLAALRDLEKQTALLQAQRCTAGVAPNVPCGCNGSRAEYKYVPQQTKAQLDLAVNALACDMTRVISFQLGQEGGGSMRVPFLDFLGPKGNDSNGETMHYFSHMDRPATDYADGGPMYNIHLWFAEQFAYLLGKLKAVIDADGKSLLDNTWVVWVTPMGEGRLHDSERLPLLTAGRAGGSVVTGRSLVTKDRFINDLLSTITHVMGAPVDTYGDPMLNKGPLAELLA